MDHFADRCYLHAKIYALRDSFLTNKNYSEIINSKNILTLLPGSAGNINPAEYNKIKEAVFRQQIQTILNFLDINDNYTILFKAFLSLFEFRNLKLLISKAYGRKNLPKIWYDINPYHTFGRELLNESTSPDMLKEILVNTFLAKQIDFKYSPDYEVLETELDILMLKNLFTFSNEFPPGQRRIFFNLMAKKVISLKITWINRLRFAYKWNDKAIKKYMHYIDDLTGSNKELKKTACCIEAEIQKKISSRFQDLHKLQLTDFPDVEYFLDKDFLRYSVKNFHNDFHSVYPVIVYLCLLYYQIQNLFIIIEGFHFNVPGEIILKRIICGD